MAPRSTSCSARRLSSSAHRGTPAVGQPVDHPAMQRAGNTLTTAPMTSNTPPTVASRSRMVPRSPSPVAVNPLPSSSSTPASTAQRNAPERRSAGNGESVRCRGRSTCRRWRRAASVKPHITEIDQLSRVGVPGQQQRPPAPSGCRCWVAQCGLRPPGHRASAGTNRSCPPEQTPLPCGEVAPDGPSEVAQGCPRSGAALKSFGCSDDEIPRHPDVRPRRRRGHSRSSRPAPPPRPVRHPPTALSR